VSEITVALPSTRLLVILQRVYILGPRTNLTWRYSHGESKEEGQEESFEKEVSLQPRRAWITSSLAVLKSFNSARVSGHCRFQRPARRPP
jgi:hypothetical protein